VRENIGGLAKHSTILAAGVFYYWMQKKITAAVLYREKCKHLF